MRKTVIFIADSLDNAHKFQQVLSGLDVDVAAGSSVQFKKLLSQHPCLLYTSCTALFTREFTVMSLARSHAAMLPWS